MYCICMYPFDKPFVYRCSHAHVQARVMYAHVHAQLQAPACTRIHEPCERKRFSDRGVWDEQLAFPCNERKVSQDIDIPEEEEEQLPG